MEFNIQRTADLSIPDTIEKVEESISMYQLQAVYTPPDGGRPEIPNNLAELPPHDLGALLGRLTAYYEYVSGIYGAYETLQYNLKKMMETTKAEVRLHAEGTVDQRKDVGETDPVVISLKNRWLDARTKARMLETKIIRPLEQNLTVISRQITVSDQEVRIHEQNMRRGHTDDAEYSLFE